MTAKTLVEAAWSALEAALEQAGLRPGRHDPTIVGPTLTLVPGTPSHRWVTLGGRVEVVFDVVQSQPGGWPLAGLAAAAAGLSDALLDAGIRHDPPQGMVRNWEPDICSIVTTVRMMMEETP